MAQRGLMGQPSPEAAEEAASTEAFETLVAGVREHIFGPAEKSVTEQLQSTDDPAREAGILAGTYMAEGVAQAKDAGVALGMDEIFGAATEIIDDILDIAMALGVLEEVTDDDREEALANAVQAYCDTADETPEERQAAMELLQEMTGEGMVDEATSYMESRAKGIENQVGGGQRGPRALMGEPAQ